MLSELRQSLNMCFSYLSFNKLSLDLLIIFKNTPYRFSRIHLIIFQGWRPIVNRFTHKEVEGEKLIMKQGRIVVPTALQPRVLGWYHKILVHPGENRMEKSLTSLYYWKNLKKDVHHHCKHCETCQLFKTTRKTKYGLLPAKTAEVVKWSRVNVDLWGP